MATALVTNDIISFRSWCVLGDQASVNTFNYNVITTTGGAVTDDDAVAAFDFAIAGFYQGTQSTHSNYDGTQLYFLKRTGSLPAPVKSTANAGAGTVSGTPLPTEVAAILKYNSFVRGPGGRGRVYLPFFATALVAADGNPTTAADTAIDSMAAVLISPLVVTSGGSSATLKWCLVKRPVAAPPSVTGEVIVAGSAHKFGQMHKRGAYGRPNQSPL